jgi:general stress protein 26
MARSSGQLRAYKQRIARAARRANERRRTRYTLIHLSLSLARFFTYGKSHKVAELNSHGHMCNLAFSHPGQQNYLSISGSAQVVRDRAEIEKRWNPMLKAWSEPYTSKAAARIGAHWPLCENLTHRCLSFSLGRFPKGTDEPDVALLKVTVIKAEFWDAPSSLVAHAISFAKAQLTGQPADPAVHKKVIVENAGSEATSKHEKKVRSGDNCCLTSTSAVSFSLADNVISCDFIFKFSGAVARG